MKQLYQANKDFHCLTKNQNQLVLNHETNLIFHFRNEQEKPDLSKAEI